jgi:leucyl-tRNA synthetase
LIKEINQPLKKDDLLTNYKKILFLMMPLIPHFSSECLEDLKINSKIEWPVADKKFLISEDTNIVIQINGKKRSIINCKKGITEKSLMKIVKEDVKINKFLNNKKDIKSIFIKGKLLNLIIKE